MRSRLQVQHAAEHLLAAGRIVGPPVPVLQLAKLAGAIVKPGPMPKELSGFLLYEGGRPTIGINSEHSETRQRFSLAHELGHLLLHPRANYVDRNFPVFFRDERSSKAEDLLEIQANDFAANLLMPREFVMQFQRGPVDIDAKGFKALITRLALRFDVSQQAMLFRLTNLGLAEPASQPSRTTRGARRASRR